MNYRKDEWSFEYEYWKKVRKSVERSNNLDPRNV